MNSTQLKKIILEELHKELNEQTAEKGSFQNPFTEEEFEKWQNQMSKGLDRKLYYRSKDGILNETEFIYKIDLVSNTRIKG